MYRRFVNDLRDPRCIPAVDAPEIVALEAERRRLVAALDTAGSAAVNEHDRRKAASAAEDALLTFADTICATIRNHPEFESEAREQVAAVQAEAESARRAARDAEGRAEEAEGLVRQLQRVAHGEMYPNLATGVPKDDPVWKADDPYVLDLMKRIRTGPV
ncbi:MAG: hypothetical protein JWR83_2971 [Aeromicrobium sp.]|nr:hypothetical protein [Aeromicrobium sp.]